MKIIWKIHFWIFLCGAGSTVCRIGAGKGSVHQRLFSESMAADGAGISAVEGRRTGGRGRGGAGQQNLPLL